MKSELSIIKGIHPGLILERELRQRHLLKGPFAISLDEYLQTLVSITKGKRILKTLMAAREFNVFRLVGGTALSLLRGHKTKRD